MHIFIHLHTQGIVGNIICMIATLLAQWLILLIKTLHLKRRLHDVMQMSLSLLFLQSPIISFFFHYFILSHFTVTRQGQMAQQLNQLKKKNPPPHTFLSSNCAPKKLLCHDSFTTIHPSSLSRWKAKLYCLHVCCF